MATTARTDYDAILKKYELGVRAEFVPWSKSRSFDPKLVDYPNKKNLNWRVTLVHKGRDIITTDYSAGIGHAPAYNDKRHGKGMTYDRARAVDLEVERGFPCTMVDWSWVDNKRPILPEAPSVVWSLMLDAEVLDYPTFEEWAPTYGYDADSRSAEAIYRQCLEIALKLRSGLGEKTLAELREAFTDF